MEPQISGDRTLFLGFFLKNGQNDIFDHFSKIVIFLIFGDPWPGTGSIGLGATRPRS